MSQKKARAERQEQRRKMEELKERVDRLTQFTETIEDQPEGPYFSCSMDLEHSEDCVLGGVTDDDGTEHSFRVYEREGHKFPCRDLDKWEVALANEDMRWDLAGMTTDGVVIDIYNLNQAVNTIINIISEKFETPIEEFDIVFKQTKLRSMIEFREQHQAEVEAARTQAQLRGRILGPDGRALNGN